MEEQEEEQEEEDVNRLSQDKIGDTCKIRSVEDM